MIYLYSVYYDKEQGTLGQVYIFAANKETAIRIFEANFGPNKHPKAYMIREATKIEREAVENTGGPSPKKAKGRLATLFSK